MDDQVRLNPSCNESLTITSYTIVSTGASGTITVSGSQNISSLQRGQSIITAFSGGSAQGFTTLGEYFVIPVNATSFKVAASKAEALKGTYLTSASGNAGAGTLYPNYSIGGVLYVGTGGTLNIRGMDNTVSGGASFSLHKNIPDASILPFMIKDINASGVSGVADLVKWYC